MTHIITDCSYVDEQSCTVCTICLELHEVAVSVISLNYIYTEFNATWKDFVVYT